MSALREFLDNNKVQFAFDSQDELRELGFLFRKEEIRFIFNNVSMPEDILNNRNRVIAFAGPGHGWWCTTYKADAGVLINIKDFL